MPKIRNFDDLTETAKWLICRTIGDNDVWPEDGSTPCFSIAIGEHEIDPTEFFQKLADEVDELIERESDDKAVERFGRVMDSISEDLYEEAKRFKRRFVKSIRDREYDDDHSR